MPISIDFYLLLLLDSPSKEYFKDSKKLILIKQLI